MEVFWTEYKWKFAGSEIHINVILLHHTVWNLHHYPVAKIPKRQDVEFNTFALFSFLVVNKIIKYIQTL